eukprot:NODE_24_length_41419_cov_0.818780.p2 type:complete len:591 gc:universal NODE_24_length_41419_cov_0.818780:34332-32560(-)
MSKDSKLKKNDDLFNDLVSIKPKQPTRPIGQIQSTKSSASPKQIKPEMNNNSISTLHDFDVGLLGNSLPQRSIINDTVLQNHEQITVQPQKLQNTDDFMDIFNKPILEPQASQISNDFSIFDRHHGRSSTAPPLLSSASNLKTMRNDKFITNESTNYDIIETSSAKIKEISNSDHNQPTNYDSLASELVNMGFERRSALESLSKNNGNMTAAIDDLLIVSGSSKKAEDVSISSSLLNKATKFMNQAKDFTQPFIEKSKSKLVPFDNGDIYFNPVDANKDQLYQEKPSVKPRRVVTDPSKVKIDNLKILKENWYTPLNPTFLIEVSESKLKADNLMRSGQYADAAKTYSVQQIRHPLFAHILLNRAICLLETGMSKEAIIDLESILELVCTKVDKSAIFDVASMFKYLNSINVDGFSFIPSDLFTVLLKKSQALENLEKYQLCLDTLQQLSSLSSDAHSIDIIKSSIKRCQMALNPAINFNNTQRQTPGIIMDVNKSERVQELRKEQEKKEEDSKKAFEAKDDIDLLIKQWSLGKELNIRALLTTVGPLMLKTGIIWKDISISDVMQPIQIKKAYMKTVSKIHPDKVVSAN